MRTISKMAIATLGFAALHSALATRAAKHTAATMVGERQRDAAYRIFFVSQSLLSFAVLLRYAAKLPKQTVYQVSGAPALLLRFGQAAGIIHLLCGLREIGFLRWAGVRNLSAYRRGLPIPSGPAAQGPEAAESGALTALGPFRWSRHPLNFSGLPIFWLTPHMTTRRLAFNVVSSVYLVLGSMHEAVRLHAAYGKGYENYVSSGIPFFWPGYRRAIDVEARP